jgi:hypothetical protein
MPVTWALSPPLLVFEAFLVVQDALANGVVGVSGEAPPLVPQLLRAAHPVFRAGAKSPQRGYN